MRRAMVVVVVALMTICLINWGALAIELSELDLEGKPLTLEQAVAIAIEWNPTTQLARQEAKAAQDRVRQAKAAWYPRLDLGVNYTWVSDLPSFAGISLGRKENITSSLTTSQAVYTGGAIPGQIRYANADLVGTLAGVSQADQQIAYRVKQAYYGVLTAIQGVQVAKDTLKAAQEHERVARAHFQAGTAPKFDVLQAEVQVADSQQVLIRAENAVKLTMSALSNALGVETPELVNLATPLVEPTPKPAEVSPLPQLDELLERAMEYRPEMAQSQTEKGKRGAGIKLAKSQLLPAISLTGTYQRYQHTSLTQLHGWTVMAVASFNLFDGGSNRAQVSEARTRLQQAETSETLLKQLIDFEVRQAYLNVIASQEQIAATAKAVEAATEAHRIAGVRYQVGVGTGVEMLDAQAALTHAKTTYNQAVYDYNLAQAQLELAVGEPLSDLLALKQGS